MRMPFAPLRSLMLAALLVGAGARPVDAQITAGIGGFATILTAPLSGVGTRALTFGVIVPGTTSVTVLPRTRSGGEFRITGVRFRQSIDISFTLPANLVGPGGATIPLNFNGNYAGGCEIDGSGNCVTATYLTWNPVTTPTFRDTPTLYAPWLNFYLNNSYEVYIGGVANPSANQRQGHYTATIGVLLVLN